MPDPNTEHGLRVQLATALRELEREKARADRAEDAARRAVDDLNETRWQHSQVLAAARRECEGLQEDIAAWMLDRADQYETDDPIWVGIADLAKGVMRGDAQEAAKHGELDADLYSRLGITEARRKEREDRLAGLGFDTRPLREQILEPSALAAPAAGRDPAIEDADAAWRDSEAHGRDK